MSAVLVFGLLSATKLLTSVIDRHELDSWNQTINMVCAAFLQNHEENNNYAINYTEAHSERDYKQLLYFWTDEEYYMYEYHGLNLVHSISVDAFLVGS